MTTLATNWKGPRHAELRKQRKACEKALRREVVAAVLRRDGWQCRCCGGKVALHVHEIVPRSLGGDPLMVSECVTLDRECHLDRGVHAMVGGRYLTIEGTNADGPLTFVWMRGDKRGVRIVSVPKGVRR